MGRRGADVCGNAVTGATKDGGGDGDMVAAVERDGGEWADVLTKTNAMRQIGRSRDLGFDLI